jgi:hypothetical protein
MTVKSKKSYEVQWFKEYTEMTQVPVRRYKIG